MMPMTQEFHLRGAGPPCQPASRPMARLPPRPAVSHESVHRCFARSPRGRSARPRARSMLAKDTRDAPSWRGGRGRQPTARPGRPLELELGGYPRRGEFAGAPRLLAGPRTAPPPSASKVRAFIDARNSPARPTRRATHPRRAAPRRREPQRWARPRAARAAASGRSATPRRKRRRRSAGRRPTRRGPASDPCFRTRARQLPPRERTPARARARLRDRRRARPS